MNRRGDIHPLPLEDLAGADVKRGRPWLLVHDPPVDAAFDVFAYGTTQDTEAIEGASPLDIRWKRLSGQRAESRFFTARLRTIDAEEVPARIGHARDRAVDIKAALRRSLGIGTDLSGAPGRTIGRGQVVALSTEVADYLDGARTAVIITEPAYAALRRHQLLLPIYHGEQEEARPGEVEADAPWVRDLPGAHRRAVIAVPLILTHSEAGRPRQPGGIIGIVQVTVDAGTMARIDDELVTQLQL